MTTKIKPGETFFSLTLKADGTFEEGRLCTVADSAGLLLNEHEFSDFGNRYNDEHLYPDGKPAGGSAPLSFFPTSLFIYCRPADVKKAKHVLASAWLVAHRETLAEAKALCERIENAIENLANQ